MNKKIVGVMLLLAIAAIGVLTFYLAGNFLNNRCIETNQQQYCPEDYENLNENAAYQKALGDGLAPKIKSRDGNTNVINTDLGGTLVYFTVENNIVVKAEFEKQ